MDVARGGLLEGEVLVQSKVGKKAGNTHISQDGGK